MSNIAIRVENLSKQYRLGQVGTGTLSHDLNRWWARIRGREDPYLKIGETNDRASKGGSEYVWALRDIDFQVKQGEVLGIIGKNGAGKSTLLKILSKVTGPTTGSIRAKGRIASLLEVGTGFHPELTGRENIYLNGTILGMTKAEVSRKLEEIVEFAGVARYLDTPVKRYSSGMMVRLGFAVAAHLEPEILIVDEVLAVGDVEFQKKAIGKMQDVSQKGNRTVLFVSHNMASVQKICNEGLLLQNGMIVKRGDINQVIDFYLNNSIDVISSWKIEETPNSPVFLQQAQITDLKDNLLKGISVGEQWKIGLTLVAREEIPHFIIALGISTKTNVSLRTIYSAPQKLERGEYEIWIRIDDLILSSGLYDLSIGLSSYERAIEYHEKFMSISISESTVIQDDPRIIRTSGISLILNPGEIVFKKIELKKK